MSDFEKDLPPLMDLDSLNPSFHESSTSLVDSAAATLGSESVQEMSDRGLDPSSAGESVSSNRGDSDDNLSDAGLLSGANEQLLEKFDDFDMSTDDDWVEESCENEHMNNIK